MNDRLRPVSWPAASGVARMQPIEAIVSNLVKAGGKPSIPRLMAPVPQLSPEVTGDENPSSPVVAARSGIGLKPIEQWMLKSVREQGSARFVGTVTLGVMVISSLASFITSTYILRMGQDAAVPSIGVGLVVPLITAPPVLYLVVRMVERLDNAGELLRVAALVDPLTGVLNRRGFFDALVAQDSVIAMVDIDKFKQINDVHGHATGDLVLQCVAGWLQSLAADTGVVARLGGDEFAVATPASRQLDLPNRQSLVSDGVAFSVTIGTAKWTAGLELDDAMALADAELYELKRALDAEK